MDAVVAINEHAALNGPFAVVVWHRAAQGTGSATRTFKAIELERATGFPVRPVTE